jgi:hypothetical protein
MYRRGWFKESYRHYLAAKGVKTSHSVAAWQKKHKALVKDFPGDNPHLTDKYARFRQKDPEAFVKGSFRTKDVGEGKKLILGKDSETGKYELQSVLVAKDYFAVKRTPTHDPEIVERALSTRRDANSIANKLVDVEFDALQAKNFENKIVLKQTEQRLRDELNRKLLEMKTYGVDSLEMIPDWVMIPEIKVPAIIDEDTKEEVVPARYATRDELNAYADEFLTLFLDIEAGRTAHDLSSSNPIALKNRNMLADRFGVRVSSLKEYFESQADKAPKKETSRKKDDDSSMFDGTLKVDPKQPFDYSGFDPYGTRDLFARKRKREVLEVKQVREKGEILRGGYADFMSDSLFDLKQLKVGTKHEMEHTRDVRIAREIAKDHLAEDPKRMEQTKKRYERRAREYAPTSPVKFARSELIRQKAFERKVKKPVFA